MKEDLSMILKQTINDQERKIEAMKLSCKSQASELNKFKTSGASQIEMAEIKSEIIKTKLLDAKRAQEEMVLAKMALVERLMERRQPLEIVYNYRENPQDPGLTVSYLPIWMPPQGNNYPYPQFLEHNGFPLLPQYPQQYPGYFPPQQHTPTQLLAQQGGFGMYAPPNTNNTDKSNSSEQALESNTPSPKTY